MLGCVCAQMWEFNVMCNIMSSFKAAPFSEKLLNYFMSGTRTSGENRFARDRKCVVCSVVEQLVSSARTLTRYGQIIVIG